MFSRVECESDLLAPLSDAKFPRLSELLGKFPERYACIRMTKADRDQAEQLLNLAEQLDILGVDKLAKESGKNFGDLLCELRFAVIFGQKGARNVEILEGQKFGLGEGVYTPDLRLLLPGEIPALVEVKRQTEWYSPLSDELGCAMQGQHLPYRIVDVRTGERIESRPNGSAPSDIELLRGEELLGSFSDGPQRSAMEKIHKTLVCEVISGLSLANTKGWQKGIVHVLSDGHTFSHEINDGAQNGPPLIEDVPDRLAKSLFGSFVFEQAGIDEDHTETGVLVVHDINPPRKRFVDNLKDKAEKRGQKLPSEHKSTIYIIAIQNDQIELSPIDVLSTLAGSSDSFRDGAARARYLRGSQTKPHPDVEKAAQTGWRPLLNEWDYLHDAESSSPERRKSLITKHGEYLNSWARDVSGVLVRHRGHSIVQWLPNPFAESEINEPRLLTIGFSIEKLGTSLLDLEP